MWTQILNGPVRQRPGLYGLKSARDIHIMTVGVLFCDDVSDEEQGVRDEFDAFCEWVVKRYRGFHTTSWWGIIDANAMGDGVSLFYELLDEFRATGSSATAVKAKQEEEKASSREIVFFFGGKALLFTIEALEYRLEAYERQIAAGGLSDDEISDIHNDSMVLRAVLDDLKKSRARAFPHLRS